MQGAGRGVKPDLPQQRTCRRMQSEHALAISICIALLREGRGLGLNTPQALNQGGLRATGRAGTGAQGRGPGKTLAPEPPIPDRWPHSSIL